VPSLEPVAAAPPGFAVRQDSEVFSGSLFSVHRLEAELPGGDRTSFDVVRHPGSVAVVALDDRERVLLVRQWRPAMGTGQWELPAGIRDEAGEPARRTAARELAEEAGARACEWQPLLVVHPSPGFSDEEVEIFLATGAVADGEPDREPAESGMTVRWVPLADAVAAVLRGDITNALAVAGLLAAWNRRPRP
jgi:8-oxo-dGTP pyrophosphatase MutT (NUDIX family)